MKFREMLNKEDILQVVQRRIAARLESAAVNDHIKADELESLAAEIRQTPAAAEWTDPAQKPPEETLILIRVEYKPSKEKHMTRAVGTGTFHSSKNGGDYWLRTNGSRIPAEIITGWQLMPKP